jgi:hypothetical protein
VDRLPPTIVDDDLLELLGRVIEIEASSQSTRELRLRIFQRDFSWQALVDLAVAHELLPPLIFSLRQRCLLPPVPSALGLEVRASHVTSRLEAAYREHLERQEDLKSQLITALCALNDQGIVPVLLKGALHLTLPMSQWHEARTMRDLDVLVRPSEAPKANQILSSLGYQPDDDPPPLDRHLPELRLPGRAGTIEIHTEALSFNARLALSTDEVWRHTEAREIDGATFLAVAAEWHMLHGLLHHQLADRGHVRRMLALKGLWEFASVAHEVTPSGWRAIIAHAKERQIFTMLSSWSIQAHRLFGLEATECLLASEAGQRHADATLKQSHRSYALRQALFLTDKLRFAFAPRTLAQRYGKSGGGGSAVLSHIAFLWRRRTPLTRRWLGW